MCEGVKCRWIIISGSWLKPDSVALDSCGNLTLTLSLSFSHFSSLLRSCQSQLSLSSQPCDRGCAHMPDARASSGPTARC